MPKLARVLDENLLRVQFDKKVRDGIFDPVARRLPADIAEERLQDATCQTFEMARRYALEKNEVLPDAILVRYCCLRAVDPGRHFIRCDGSQRLRDVLDFRNFANGRVEVLHLDGVAQDDDGELPKDGDSQLLGLAEAMSCSVERKLNSALDLEAWLHGLDGDERQMLAARGRVHARGDRDRPRLLSLDGVRADETARRGAGSAGWREAARAASPACRQYRAQIGGGS